MQTRPRAGQFCGREGPQRVQDKVIYRLIQIPALTNDHELGALTEILIMWTPFISCTVKCFITFVMALVLAAAPLFHHAVGVEPAQMKDNSDISDNIYPLPPPRDRQTVWSYWRDAAKLDKSHDATEHCQPAPMAARGTMSERDRYSMLMTFRASPQSDTSCSSAFRIDHQLAVSAPSDDRHTG